MDKTPTKYEKTYHVKKGDAVKVISGKWKSFSGTITAILKKKDRVVLEMTDLTEQAKKRIGVRTVKKTAANPKGGLVERSVSVHVSNVQKKD